MTVSERHDYDTFGDRVRDNPAPALKWVAVLAILVVPEFGAIVTFVISFADGVVSAWPTGDPFAGTIEGARATAESIPSLLSRETIPNRGHRTSVAGGWEGTFLGLEPKHAWLIRFLLVYLYAAAFCGWLAHGYTVYKTHYRQADWTPFDDVVRRFRRHSWGKFGLVVVLGFVVMALFAPTLGPTTNEVNNLNPYGYTVEYFDEDAGQVEEVYVGDANRAARSQGAGEYNTGIWQYDDFDRFHPFGTTASGKDLFTFMMYGARVSMFVGLLSIVIMGTIATLAGLATAYYKGAVDLAAVIVGDSMLSIPLLLVLIMINAVFQGHWLDGIYNGGLLIALVFGFFNWPALWRAIRGPAFQVSEEEWVDAARSFGQRPIVTMRKHMLPYVTGYLLIYASMTLGGVILGTAALTFLGIGINEPTPEWGRAVAIGRNYVATQSWHTAIVPGLMVVVVVTAFNALGDGIRDAIDPQSEGGDSSEAAAGGVGA